MLTQTSFQYDKGTIVLSSALLKITHYSAAVRRKAYLYRSIYLLTESYLLRNKCILVSNFQINRTRRVCDFVVLHFLYRVEITTGQMPCAVSSSFFVFWRTRPQKFGNRFRIISILYARIVIVLNVSLTPPPSPPPLCAGVYGSYLWSNFLVKQTQTVQKTFWYC